MFCTDCIEGYIATETENAERMVKCPECDKLLTGLGRVDDETSLDGEGSEMDDSNNVASKARSRAHSSVSSWVQNVIDRVVSPGANKLVGRDGKQLGRDTFNVQPRIKKSNSKFLWECDKKYPEPVVPSAKTAAVKDIVITWQAQAPEDKIIIFTQFIAMGTIIGRMLQAEGIPFLYFCGNMSQKQKAVAIDGFHKDQEVKVLVSKPSNIAIDPW
jgi:SNF2 family DNA or RNA helicase